MSGDPHTGFIVASYAAAALVVAGLVIHAALDYRAQKSALARLEASGLRRRSQPDGAGRRS